ncbi:MAG: carbamate kinase [Desulfobacterales bacterium]
MGHCSKPILLVALGGNALIRKGQTGTIQEQFDNLKMPIQQIARLSRSHRIIITHGNGPQVGNLLLQQEYCPEVPRLPLEILVAQTEGQIGYMIESTLDSELMAQGVAPKPLVSLITYVVVDSADPAFQSPSKPIGPVYPEAAIAGLPFPVIDTPKGFRRAVASPEPVTIIENREIRQLIDMDFIVICCGGGGIPVKRQGRAFSGVNAVIDKDLASAKLAVEVGVDLFCIATDVSGVALDFGTPSERFLDTISVGEATRLIESGQLHSGSMGPKVAAASRFSSATGQRSVITAIESIEAAVEGRSGTSIEPGGA